MKVQVREFMSYPVITTTIDSDVSSAREMMERKDVSALPVVELKTDNIRICGIVTLYDLAGITDESTLVSEVMTTDIRTVSPETSVTEAASLMLEQDIHHLIVLDHGHIAGIISSIDFVRLLADKRTPSLASVIFV